MNSCFHGRDAAHCDMPATCQHGFSTTHCGECCLHGIASEGCARCHPELRDLRTCEANRMRREQYERWESGQ